MMARPRVPGPLDTRGPMWQRCGAAMVWLGEQRGQEWRDMREGRLGSSSVGAALGHSRFETPLEVCRRMLGILPPKEMNEAMRQGVVHEDAIREEYEEFRGLRVREVGLAVRVGALARLRPDGSPAPPPAAGAGEGAGEDADAIPAHLVAVSPDGLVGDEGMIEVKNAQRPYRPLVEGCELHDLESAHERRDFECLRHFIWDTHYDQMQLAMACMGRRWCDYVVKESTTRILRVVRVPLDAEYWNAEMLPGLARFFRAHAAASRVLPAARAREGVAPGEG